MFKLRFVNSFFMAIVFFLTGCDIKNTLSSHESKAQLGSNSEKVINSQISTVSLPLYIKFYESALPTFISSSKGLADSESFGRWSIGKLVILDFIGFLPAEFDVEMVLGGFGPNIGSELLLVVGSETRKIKVKGDITHMETYTAHFTITDKISTISLIIPQPTSPKALGVSHNDSRMLGIALQSILIK